MERGSVARTLTRPGPKGTLYDAHRTLCSILLYLTLHYLHQTLNTVYTLLHTCTRHYILKKNLYTILYTIFLTLCTLYSTLRTICSTLYTVYSMIYTAQYILTAPYTL